MAAGTALLCSTLLVVLVFVSADPKIITAESGQDVTLTCRAPSNNNTGATWIKDDFWTEYVFWNQDSHFHPDGQFVPDNQDPSFKNWVDLQDRQMKDGDVSLILKDVTINDTGTYQCRVFMEETFSWALISSINLRVIRHEEHTIVLLSVLLPVVDLLVLLVLLMRRCVHRKLEADGEDDITSSITYSVGKSSNHQQPPDKKFRDRETDSAVIYSAVKTEDISYGQTTIRTRRPSFPGPL